MAPSIAYPASPPQTPISFSLKPQKSISVDVVEIIEEEDPLDNERARLRRHLGLSNPNEPPCETPQIQPLFFIERVPDTKGVTCSLPGCTQGIQHGDLRFALNPGMGGDTWFRSSSDYYHIPCFSTLADFTNPTYLNLIHPLTRHTFKHRGLKPSSVLDGSYLVPCGVERLILEWKYTRAIALDKRDGVYDENLYRLDPSVHDLLYKAGSAGYWPEGRPAGLDQYEYYVLLKMCAVNEGDGWNLFEQFLGKGEGEGRDLSEVLRGWERGFRLAWGREADNEDRKEGPPLLSPTAVRAIRRLSAIPTPQVGFNRLYC
ncbi:hypothetical protein BDW59DRAFT_179806 [Aspergillus cavernicola]|uniref:Uncharacterized protein n=1 Tax=Aspergillus cavernicola TaxID=176166 RepID=A0ABR4IDK2_9EURO